MGAWLHNGPIRAVPVPADHPHSIACSFSATGGLATDAMARVFWLVRGNVHIPVLVSASLGW